MKENYQFPVRRTASITKDGLHRRWLRRQWGKKDDYVLWVMLNPSTADARVDDKTIRRCIGFTRRQDADSLVVMNLFTYRATKPKVLLHRLATDVQDSQLVHENLKRIVLASRKAMTTIVAWGGLVHPLVQARAAEVTSLLTEPYCLGVTKAGHPRHPLYVPYATKYMPYPVIPSTR